IMEKVFNPILQITSFIRRYFIVVIFFIRIGYFFLMFTFKVWYILKRNGFYNCKSFIITDRDIHHHLMLVRIIIIFFHSFINNFILSNNMVALFFHAIILFIF